MAEDRRIRRTKKRMTAALGTLLLEKPLKNITVREIAALADINRGTFYLHYKDVYDMADQILNEVFVKFNEIVSAYEPKKNADTLFPMLVEIFSLLAENADLTRCMIGKNGDAAFVDKLKNTIHEKCFLHLQDLFHFENEDEWDYFYNFIISGCIGLIGAWLEGGQKETPQQMAALAEKMILKGIGAFT
ncbi:TetR/AcrR family transcriptional regulator C-terminal domain-containing protein [Anaerotignum sp.]